MPEATSMYREELSPELSVDSMYREELSPELSVDSEDVKNVENIHLPDSQENPDLGEGKRDGRPFSDVS